MSTGLLDSEQGHLREVLADPLMGIASAAIGAQRPSPRTIESRADCLALTIRIRKAGELLGINVLGHPTPAPGGYASMRHLGHISAASYVAERIRERIKVIGHRLGLDDLLEPAGLLPLSITLLTWKVPRG